MDHGSIHFPFIKDLLTAAICSSDYKSFTHTFNMTIKDRLLLKYKFNFLKCFLFTVQFHCCCTELLGYSCMAFWNLFRFTVHIWINWKPSIVKCWWAPIVVIVYFLYRLLHRNTLPHYFHTLDSFSYFHLKKLTTRTAVIKMLLLCAVGNMRTTYSLHILYITKFEILIRKFLSNSYSFQVINWCICVFLWVVSI